MKIPTYQELKDYFLQPRWAAFVLFWAWLFHFAYGMRILTYGMALIILGWLIKTDLEETSGEALRNQVEALITDSIERDKREIELEKKVQALTKK